jgi:hypothetical protein
MKSSPNLVRVLILSVLIAISINACGSGNGGNGLDVGNGSDSENKTGAFAVDFSLCPGHFCIAIANGRNVNPVPSIADTELTIEAWVKSKATDGGIFSRMDPSRGVILYVKNDEPKFAMRVQTAITSTPDSPTPTAAYVVGSGFKLLKDAWTHIAGVIANEDHSSVHPAVTCLKGDGSPGGETETPHLDVYVNGEIKKCGTTWGAPNDQATGPQFADNPSHERLYLGFVESGPIDGVDGTINAVIDEVRFWMTGRTVAQIQTCMNQDLGSEGDCSSKNPDLIGYWPFNEGEGSIVTDFSGNGLSASLLNFRPYETAWEDGWVTGYP